MPAEPVRRALRKYLDERGRGERVPNSEHRDLGGSREHRYASCVCVLAEKLGVSGDCVNNWASNKRYQSMQFDTADKILTAIDQVSLWWQDPELSKVYEEACRGADRIYPLQAAA